MPKHDKSRQWSRLRFSVVGGLLSSPPSHGELKNEIEKLKEKNWKRPNGEQKPFGYSTIERWYYKSRHVQDPTDVLRRKVRKDAGDERVMGPPLLKRLEQQYREHPGWSYQLHADNLIALVEEEPNLGSAPSLSTVRRRMRKRGWFRKRKARTRGQRRAQERLEQVETRSFEKTLVHQLWHFDFHVSSRRVALPNGTYITPVCLCVLDDFSRLCCHIQWYPTESSETLAHGLWQAFLKRGLPREFLSDNGSAMIASETQQACHDLSIIHHTTLASSPHQNGKQESYWSNIEGRLMAMLESTDNLSLKFLNQATLAWVEFEYNHKTHQELSTSPIQRVLSGKSVHRSSPEISMLQFSFTRIIQRTQRRSDGTISIDGIRFEIPGRMRHCSKVTVRYAQWDLRQAYIVDPRNNKTILATIHPLDKAKNADGRRRSYDALDEISPQEPLISSLPPLLRKLMRKQQTLGQPAPYIPHPIETGDKTDA